MLSTDLLDRQLLDALPVSAYTLDLEGRIVGVHQPAARFGHETGIPASRTDEPRDRALWDVAEDAFPQHETERAMLLLRTGRAPIVQWEVVRGEGPEGHALLAQLTPLHDDSHAVTGFVATTTDMTASHRAYYAALDVGVALARAFDLDRIYQDAAHHVRQLFRPDLIVIALVEAADASHTPHIAYDSGTDNDRRATTRRFGDTWKEVLERRGIHMARADAAWELTAPLAGSNEPVGVISIAGDDPSVSERIAEHGRLLAAIAMHLGAAIERARTAARAENRQRIQAMGEVALGMAQELRNPVFGISSAAQLLRFRAREDPVMEKNAGRILREVERLNRMVTTLVELGRPVTLNRSAGDPDNVWDDVLEGERGRLESRAVAVRRKRPHHHASVSIDAEQLAQAFRSVLSNAVEAAPEASDITLTSSSVRNGGWRCQLVNGGPPIPADVLPRVFDVFVSTKPGNTGTGLAHARRIIDEHGGTITIASSPESGTVVTITLR